MRGLIASFGESGGWWEAAESHFAVGASEKIATWRDGPCAQISVANSKPQQSIYRSYGCTLAILGAGLGDAVATRLIRAYRRNGLAALAGLSARTGFVLWDSEQKRAIGACDALAQQPLAYVGGPSCAAFSSRVIDLLGHSAARNAWDPVYLADWIAGLASQPQSRTAFAGISRCPPGSAVVWDQAEPLPPRVCGLDRARGSKKRHWGASRAEFWARIGRSAAEMGKGSAVALSGGLDSAVIALARGSANHEAFNAYTYAPLQATRQNEAVSCLAGLLPNMRLNLIRTDVAGGGDQSGVVWALRDDPAVGGEGGRGGRRMLLREAARQGEDALLDGEGGDEIFELATGWRDLWHEKSRAKAAIIYLTDSRWGARAALRAFEHAAPMWWATRPRTARRHGLPGWLSDAFWQSTACQEAFAADRVRRSERAYERRLKNLLTSAAFVGRQSADRLDGRCVGIQVRSPLVNPDVLALVCDAPAQARVQPGTQKAFLRNVARGCIPEGLMTAEEGRDDYGSMLQCGLAAASWDEISAAAETAPFVGEWIDLRRLEQLVLERPQLQVREADALYALVQGLIWMANVNELLSKIST